MLVDLDDLLLAPSVVMDWHAACEREMEKLEGFDPSTIPDEQAEILDDGRLRVFVEMDGDVLMERVYPPGSWARRS